MVGGAAVGHRGSANYVGGVLAQFALKVLRVHSWIRGSQCICASQGSASAAAAASQAA